jgi:hypothetical protein
MAIAHSSQAADSTVLPRMDNPEGAALPGKNLSRAF